MRWYAVLSKGGVGEREPTKSPCTVARDLAAIHLLDIGMIGQTPILKPGDFLTFRWTPIDATPTEPVTYRLKVWQLMQGQNGTAAMRSNQPIITKDVDNVDHFTVESSILGPCKPPYMCDFVWEVQSGSPTGKLVGKPQIGSIKYDLKMMK